MNDDNNLTPEELEKLQREEAQQKTGPNLYDRLNQTKNSYEDYQNIKNKIQVRKSKNISEISSNSAKTGTKAAATGTGAAAAGTGAAAAGTGAAATGTGATAAGTGAAAAGTGAAAAGTGAAAAGTGAAAAGVGILPILGFILLGILTIGLVGAFVASIYYSIVDPISTKYSVDPETIINDYDINDIPDDAKDENGNFLSDSDVGGIRNILNTDDLDLDELFGGVSSSKLGVVESIQAKLYKWFNWLPGSSYSEALINKIIEINLNDKLSEMGTDDKEQLPLGALLTTFTYTYASQYLDSNTNTYKDIADGINGSTEEVDVNRVNPSTPISMIRSLFKEEILTIDNPNDIVDLLDNMVFHEFYPTYSWGEVDRDCEYDDDGNLIYCTIYMGCSKSDNESYKLDYYKYYLYLRYGAYVSGYAVDSSNNYQKLGVGNTEQLWGKTGVENYKDDSDDTIAFGYEYFKNLNAAYISSSAECELKEVADESLAELNAASDDKTKYKMITGDVEHSVDRANNFFKARDVTNGVDEINNNHEIFSDFSKYDEKANPHDTLDLSTPYIKIDNSKPNGNGNFAVNYNNGENYEYKHGWIYNRFPFFRDEFQKEEGTVYLYDSVKTPKTIELQIEDIDSYKEVFNDVLGYDTSIYASGGWSSSFNSDGTESFPLPVGKYIIKSCFGYRNPINTGHGITSSNHGGIDIPAPFNTPIYSWKSGIVVVSTFSSSYGNYVVVDHGDVNGERIYTLYAHMTVRNVSVGDSVQIGQQLGTVGSTGMSTGSHLHFEIRTGGTEWSNATKQDPYPTLAEIVGGENLPSICTEGTILDVKSTLINGNQTNSENKQQLCKLLVNKFSQNGAIALMANAAHESGYNTDAHGDGGTSYGLFQWRNERKQGLMSSYPNSYNTVQSQYNYLLTELNGYSSLYNDLISGNKSSKELTYDFCYYFERPVNKEMSCKNRMSSAEYSDAESYVKNGCQ